METGIDVVYYHRLGSSGGTERRLNFAPGSAVLYSSSPQYAELPNNFIKSAKLERGFDRDMPVGQQLADNLAIELNLRCLGSHSVYGYDSGALRAYILRQQSTETVVVNGEAIYIPNRWFITESDDGGSSWNLVWDGVQERVKQYELGSDGTHKINVLGLAETVLRNLKIDRIGQELWEQVKQDSTRHVKELMYDRFSQNDRTFVVTVPPALWGKDGLRFAGAGFNAGFMALVRNDAGNLIRAYRRTGDTDNTLVFIHDFLSWMDFYRQDCTTAAAPGTAISDRDDILVISHVFKNNEEKTLAGGLLFNGDCKESWYKDYRNVFNVFRLLAENFFCKLFYCYSGKEVRACFNPVFTYIDDSTQPVAIRQLGAESVLNDFKITYGAEFEMSITHVGDLTENDINEYSSVNSSFGLDEGGYEIKNIIHNIRVSPALKDWPEDYKRLFREGQPDGLNRMPLPEAVLQCLFYYDSSLQEMLRIHEWCSVSVDGTNKIGNGELSTSIPNLHRNRLENAARNYYRNFLLDRQAESGIGALTSKAAAYCFNNKNQGMMEFTASTDVINVRDLGLHLHIDFTGLLGYGGAPFPAHSANAFVTALEADLTGNTIDVTAFIRGDNAFY